MTDFNLYIYSKGNNLGDMMGYYILKKHFPDIVFNPDSKNYLFFGGSTFYCRHWLDSPERIIYFGNGLSSFSELSSPEVPFEPSPPKIPFVIYPRGYITKDMLEVSGMKCKSVIGDIAQFIALEEPAIHNDSLPTLYIKDAFKDVDFIPTYSPIIGVCDTSLTKGVEIISDINIFRKIIGDFGKVISSQIHPFLIALMMGKPAKLIPKDSRALDICNYFNIPFDCTVEDAMRVREMSLKNIPEMKRLLYLEISNK